MLQPEMKYRLCLRCGHLNPELATKCEFACGFLQTRPHPLPAIAEGNNVTICPTCGALYSVEGGACKNCNTSLLFGKDLYPKKKSASILYCHNCKKEMSSITHLCLFCSSMRKITIAYHKRPILPIILLHNTSQVRCGGLIDTGADFNVFPSAISHILGIDLSQAPMMRLHGISEEPIEAYEVKIRLGIGVRQYETGLFFSDSFRLSDTGLLGNLGFLNRFFLEYSGGKKNFTLIENPHCLEHGYTYYPLDSHDAFAFAEECS